jgi:PAS domain S-box-containing protein
VTPRSAGLTGGDPLRAALDHADEAVVVADATGHIVFANAAIERLVGRPPNELMGRHFVVALGADDDPRSYQSILTTVSGGVTWSGRVPVSLPDGTRGSADLAVTPLHDASGSVAHVIAVARQTDGEVQAAPERKNATRRERSGEPGHPPLVRTSRRRAIGDPTPTRSSVRASVEQVLRDRAFGPVFQPIVRLADGETIGFEALTRFHDGRSPDIRFAQAAAVGLGLDLEIETLRASLAASAGLPDGVFLSVNVSPALVLNRTRLEATLRAATRPIVLEITEREPVIDYGALRSAISRIVAPLQWAIDDAGAGYASLRHIIELRPQFVKLDRELIAGIALDPARQALVAGLLHFSDALGTMLIGEGIETTAERIALRRLGVVAGQGWLLGRPARIDSETGPPSGYTDSPA